MVCQTQAMDRPEERTTNYLRESPYTFEGEVEFLQGAARSTNRRGWGKYARWSIYAVAVAFGAGVLIAAVSAVL